jgi:hypothetical protein
MKTRMGIAALYIDDAIMPMEAAFESRQLLRGRACHFYPVVTYISVGIVPVESVYRKRRVKVLSKPLRPERNNNREALATMSLSQRELPSTPHPYISVGMELVFIM